MKDNKQTWFSLTERHEVKSGVWSWRCSFGVSTKYNKPELMFCLEQVEYDFVRKTIYISYKNFIGLFGEDNALAKAGREFDNNTERFNQNDTTLPEEFRKGFGLLAKKM